MQSNFVLFIKFFEGCFCKKFCFSLDKIIQKYAKLATSFMYKRFQE